MLTELDLLAQVPSPSQMRRVQAGLAGDLLQGVRMLGHKRWNAKYVSYRKFIIVRVLFANI